jgi:hypothetical protein
MKKKSYYSIAVTTLLTAILMHLPLKAEKTRQMDEARELFYSAVENGKIVNEAKDAFKTLWENDKIDSGLALTYLGAIEALKGKHSSWPHQKLRHVNRGLRMMDAGIKADPANLESRFVRGSTCHSLPSFFQRQDTARADFLTIIELLPEQINEYDADVVNGMIDFISKNFAMTDSQRGRLQSLKNEMANNED